MLFSVRLGAVPNEAVPPGTFRASKAEGWCEVASLAHGLC